VMVCCATGTLITASLTSPHHLPNSDCGFLPTMGAPMDPHQKLRGNMGTTASGLPTSLFPSVWRISGYSR
nr:hypothetical protein [Tanacetum cinerariifolium]